MYFYIAKLLYTAARCDNLKVIYALYKLSYIRSNWCMQDRIAMVRAGLDYRALGSIFFKYITNSYSERTGADCTTVFLCFFGKVLISSKNEFYFTYNTSTIMHALIALYNLFFYAGMYSAKLSIYSPTKFKHMWESINYFSTTDISSRSNACLRISTISENNFNSIILQYIRHAPDIFFCINTQIGSMQLYNILRLNCCTIGLCVDFDTLWYYDVGFPVCHSTELVQLFFFNLVVYGLFRGLGHTLFIYQQQVYQKFTNAIYHFIIN